MGKRTKSKTKSYTLPSSPSHSFSSSSSSSDFEFTISISPRKSSPALCPADELFYKGQLLPLHLSPRISMVRTLLLSSAARDSTSSTSNDSFTSDPALFPDCDSSRPSSVTDLDDEFKRLHNPPSKFHIKNKPPNKYFSFSRFSSVFRNKPRDTEHVPASSVKRLSATAREVIRKYMKKVKPLYEKLSQKQQKTGEELLVESNNPETTSFPRSGGGGSTVFSLLTRTERSAKEARSGGGRKESGSGSSTVLSHSFSGNLRYPRRRRGCVSSCPSSMRSSPSHSGVLSHGGGGRDASSMEELQSAIQGAIAHCKNSLVHKTVVSNEI